MKIHRLTCWDHINTTRKKWHPFYDKTGNIEVVLDKWMQKNVSFVSLKDADVIYAPIQFVNFFKVHCSGHRPSNKAMKPITDGLYTEHFLQNSHKYFTACQWVAGTVMDTKDMLCFMSTARKDNEISIPLCTDEHPILNIKKDILASFVGNVSNHRTRKQLQNKFRDNKKIIIKHSVSDLNAFVNLLNRSIYSLCPRGVGPGSFRLFEALQVGSIPIIISDSYKRPYSNKADWDKFSISVPESDIDKIDSVLAQKRDIKSMSKAGMEFFRNYCCRQKVCEGILEEIKNRYNQK